MKNVHTYHVVPSIPERLMNLKDLAFNLRWAWDHETIALFRRLDRDLWEATGHNPVLMLGTIEQSRLREAEGDESFLAHLERVHKDYERYMTEPAWFQKAYPEFKDLRIAYFSAEFGLTECLPIYSGGLGILAGDHLKSASELGLPLVGVGLLYQKGYFRQYLNVDGWQQERYPTNDFYNMPLQPVRKEDGRPVFVELQLLGRKVRAQVWRVHVGRVPLYLLDTNLPANRLEDQDITDELYGGDRETRIRQEIVLGIGGMKALAAMGIHPEVCHMNEGHAAFLGLERVHMLVEAHGLTCREARQASSAGNVFTTHTPVPAGFDLFEPDLVKRYFGDYAASLNIPFDVFLGLGRSDPSDTGELFNMANLAMKHASACNGVSRLHGSVTRRMLHATWADFPEHEVPVASITNGIHIRSWISWDMAQLLDRYLGPKWMEGPTDLSAWERVSQIPDEELWRTHERRRERMVAFARRHLLEQLERRGASEHERNVSQGVLDPEAITIGFARRFATYKRATLMLREPERLRRILCDRERPAQIVMAGKAHPMDHDGKELIKQIVHFARDEQIRRHVVFLEDYDISVARYLVQGVDVWLNTPRRPMEASGTSGMKVLANGGLNLSIKDGWWDEGYDPSVGWSIGNGEEYEDHDYQDRVETDALYDLLEREVVPLFYDRGTDGLPRGWIAKMKASMSKLCPVFNTNRMVHDYVEQCYLPAARRYRSLTQKGMERVKELIAWKTRLRQQWGEVRIEGVEGEPRENAKVGMPFAVRAHVRLGSIEPQEVSVQIYNGLLDTNRDLPEGSVIPMSWEGTIKDGAHLYQGNIPCNSTGLHGFSIRVIPCHEDAVIPLELPLVVWE